MEEIQGIVKTDFEDFFKEGNENRLVPEGLDFKKLNMEESKWMTRPFSEEGVKEEIWSCDGNKSVGLDGYFLEFYKQNREVLKVDIIIFVTDFPRTSKHTKACTSSFIILISKVNNPHFLEEYRPIFLVRSLHKIMSKLLETRLKGVLRKLISLNQTTFVLGRNIANGVLVVN